jgi:hypothetical protein
MNGMLALRKLPESFTPVDQGIIGLDVRQFSALRRILLAQEQVKVKELRRSSWFGV